MDRGHTKSTKQQIFLNFNLILNTNWTISIATHAFLLYTLPYYGKTERATHKSYLLQHNNFKQNLLPFQHDVLKTITTFLNPKPTTIIVIILFTLIGIS